MDSDGFRKYLQEREISEKEIISSLALIDRFEAFVKFPDNPTKETFLEFSNHLIETGDNSLVNYYSLARYAYFSDNNEAYIAIVDLLDGAEAMGNLYQEAESTLGTERRDSVFEGIELPKLGLPKSEKVKITQKVMPRLEAIASPEECEDILADSLRDLPDVWYENDKKLYEECDSLDDYLDMSAKNFIAQLENLRDDVIEFVRNEPLIARGLHEGNILCEVKIPHQTIEFLAETDPQKKRYYYCHCPWVKESLKDEPSDISAKFCTCSAGFQKRRWEIIFDQKLKAEIVESVLQGDNWCKSAID